MSRHGRPHQPHLGEQPRHPGEEGPGGPPAEEPGDGPPAAGEALPPGARIRVNDGSKVSPLTDEHDLEEVPGAGGRFSAWRRHRQERSATRMLTASRLPAGDGPVREGSTAVGAAGVRSPGPGSADSVPPGSVPRSSVPTGSGSTAAGATVVAFPGPPAAARRRRRLVAVLAVVLALAVLAAVLFLSPVLAVREVAVRGAQLTDPARVEQAVEGYHGVPLTRISKQEVRERVGRIPQVRSIEVLLEPPHRLVVQLHERVPVAAVEDGGEFLVVDSEGVALTTARTAQEAGVPVVTGGREVVGSERFEAIAAVLAALPESVLAELRTASAESLASVELAFEDGRTVVWGTAENSELKAQVLRELVEARGADSGVGTYDVSSPTRPVVR